MSEEEKPYCGVGAHVWDMKGSLKRQLEQVRLFGIEEGKKQAIDVMTKAVGKSIFQMTDEYGEELRREGRLEMLKEIEKIRKWDTESTLAQNEFYVLVKDFEALKKKVEK